MRFERYHQLKAYADAHPDRLAAITEEELLVVMFQESEKLPLPSESTCSALTGGTPQGGETV